MSSLRIAASSLIIRGSERLDEMGYVGLRAMDLRRWPKRLARATTFWLVEQVLASLYSAVRRNSALYKTAVGSPHHCRSSGVSEAFRLLSTLCL